jgi:hypothetical protein
VKEKGVEVFDRYQTTYFGLRSRFLANARKLSEKYAVALNRNNHAFNFQDNIGQPSLGQEFEATAIYVGYVSNLKDPMNPKVFIVCPQHNGVAWAIELKREGGAIVVERPFAPPPDLDDEHLVEVPDAKDKAKKSGDE